MEENKQTYSMVYKCLNCGTKLYKEIPYGESAPRIGGFKRDFPDEVCRYCDCTHFSCPFHPNDPRAK
jgi:hypothetical protein